MKVISSAIKNGVIDDKYGKFGEDFIGDMPSYSMPFEILDAPEQTKSFVIILDDADAIEVCGFVWIHWLVANLTQNSLPENSSQNNNDYLQGQNSWGANVYGGMAPPNSTHVYKTRVFALDTLLELQDGFDINELEKAMSNHIIASCEVEGSYRHI